MSKSSSIGKKHVLQVSKELRERLKGNVIQIAGDPIKETVQFICKKYPDIVGFVNKYETTSPDTSPDLLLHLKDGEKVRINLFSIKGFGSIQPKNLGAKSFLKKYFQAGGLQTYFNDYLQTEYMNFLRQLISTKEKVNEYDRLPLLKQKASGYYPRFTDVINPLRTRFLMRLREYCFVLIKEEYNVGGMGIQTAFDQLMLVGDTTIITRRNKENKCLLVEEWKSEINSDDGIEIYKKGNDTIGIRAGNEALTIRFKFESGPTSSIKLATSYETFPEESIIVDQNERSLKKFEKYIQQHSQTKDDKNNQDAIGKCNESMIYYRILKENPFITQIVEDEYHTFLLKNIEKVSREKIIHIRDSSEITVQKIYQYLQEKYGVYDIMSIQLVTDSYVKNRLDTSDLQLILFTRQKYVIESLSLKAIARRNMKITAKNPGAGTLLGPTYFNIGSLVIKIEEVKQKFQRNLLKHRQAQEMISEEIGKALSMAPQDNLKRGVQSLLGDQTMVVTIYAEKDSIVLKHDSINDSIEVLSQTPSAIQTTLRWNAQQEELALRVKFSKGHQHGWSSIKLACDYVIKYIST